LSRTDNAYLLLIAGAGAQSRAHPSRRRFKKSGRRNLK